MRPEFPGTFPYEFFHNKKVCITGGHDSSLDINGDIHAAVNSHYKRQRIDPDVYFGSSCEDALPNKKVWYAMINRADNLNVWARHCEFLFTFDRERTIKPKADYRDEWLNTFQHQINDNPLSGMIALRWFTLLPVKSIYVSGMDFYNDDKHLIDSNNYIYPHHIPTQRQWARELWRTDLRVQYSPHLMRVLNLVGLDRGAPFVTEIDQASYDEFIMRSKL
jgi:hypothetical protein